MPASNDKPQLLYPWDVQRAYDEKTLSAQEQLEHNVVSGNFTKYFGVSPSHFNSLEKTPSHKLAEDLLTWLFKGQEYDPMWFTLVFANAKDFSYVQTAARLACLAFSLTSGYASAQANSLEVVKAFMSAYKDEQPELFDLFSECGLLLLYGLDTSYIDDAKASTAFSDLLQDRVAAPNKRTLILCQTSDALNSKSANKAILGSEFARLGSAFKIPVSDEVSSGVSGSASPIRSFNIYPDHLVKSKRTQIPQQMQEAFVDARLDTLVTISNHLGKAFTHNLNSFSDSIYIY